LELVNRFQNSQKNEYNRFFDPYAGVGSALIAAVKQYRRAMGSEQDQAYVEIARDRVMAFFNGDLRLRPMGKPVYQPTGNEKVSRVPPEWQETT
jgi:adenine-specific DNA-methyltransferase